MPSPDHTAHRDRAIRLTVAASVGAKGFSILCTLAQVPIALHYLGGEAYGLWIALMSLHALLNFLDFGVGVGMQQKMAQAFGRDDWTGLRRIHASGVATLGALGLASLVVGLPAALLGDWGRWFELADPALRADAPAALALIVAGFVAGLPGNAVVRLAAAVQLGWLQAIWNAVGNGLTLVAVWWAARAGWHYLPFIAVSALLPAVQNVGLWFHLRRRFGWRSGGPGFLPAAQWREMMHASLLFTLPQLGLAALNWLPPFAISLGAGAAAVTAFNLVQRLLSPLNQGQLILLTPLWPAYSEALVRRDHGWLHKARRRSLQATLALAAGMAVLCAAARPLIRWWVGAGTPPPDAQLTWMTGAWFALLLLGRHYLYYLVGIDRLRPLALHSTLGFAGAVAGLWLGSPHGAAAALAAGAAGYAVLGLPGMLVASHRGLAVES